jgi:hypothetical protein
MVRPLERAGVILGDLGSSVMYAALVQQQSLALRIGGAKSRRDIEVNAGCAAVIGDEREEQRSEVAQALVAYAG